MQLLHSIQRHLPQVRHQVLLMPQTRIHQALNNKEPSVFSLYDPQKYPYRYSGIQSADPLVQTTGCDHP